jgi:hypothetical protein
MSSSRIPPVFLIDFNSGWVGNPDGLIAIIVLIFAVVLLLKGDGRAGRAARVVYSQDIVRI